MKKKIKKWGNSFVITFSPEDLEVYGIKEGDIIELDDMLIQKRELERDEKRKKNHKKKVRS